jgi:fatty acid desaturase
MEHKPLFLVMFIQMLKVSAFGMLFTICLWFFALFLPFWLIGIIFFVFFFFVLIPIYFGIGPLGRKYGNEINEAAIEHARQQRENDSQNF